MGITLGWVALLLAGATGAPPEEKNTAPISYTVKMVEADGVGWRASAMSQLKPVTRQGAATVWTLPKSASKNLIQEIKNSASIPIQDDEAKMCLELLSKDVDGTWLTTFELGSVKSVVLQGVAKSGIEIQKELEAKERVRKV